MEETNKFKKNFIWNILGTGLSAFTSLFLMITVTRINGIDNAGIFTLAFSTACILYMFGIYAGRVYQVTENNKNITDKDYIVNRIISCILIVIVSLLFVFIKKYSFYKSLIFIILAIYKSLEAFAETLYAVLQKNDYLDKAGKSTFIKSLIGIPLFIIIDIISKNLVISCLSMVVVHIIVLLFYDFKNVNKLTDLTIQAKKDNILNIFKYGFFPFAIAFLGVYMTNVQKYAIDAFLEDNIQAIFGIVIMPATVMGLLAQFLIHPYLNQFFELYKCNKYKEIKKLLYKIILIVLIVGAICSILGYFLGAPVLGFIYGLDLSNYSISLLVILIAATFFTVAGIISPILITMRCTVVQFIVYVGISIFETILSVILVYKFKFDGAIWSYLITMVIYVIVFYITAMVIINKKESRE